MNTATNLNDAQKLPFLMQFQEMTPKTEAVEGAYDEISQRWSPVANADWANSGTMTATTSGSSDDD